MAHRLTIEPQSVQETMFLPVLGRAKYSHLYPELLDDPRDQAYIWKLVIRSIAAILLRFEFMGLSGSLSHIAAYGILFKRLPAADIEADLIKLFPFSDGMPLVAEECV